MPFVGEAAATAANGTHMGRGPRVCTCVRLRLSFDVFSETCTLIDNVYPHYIVCDIDSD